MCLNKKPNVSPGRGRASGQAGGGVLIQRRRTSPETKRCLIRVSPLRKEEGLYAALNTHCRPLSGDAFSACQSCPEPCALFWVQMALTVRETRGGAQSLASKRVGKKEPFHKCQNCLFFLLLLFFCSLSSLEDVELLSLRARVWNEPRRHISL